MNKQEYKLNLNLAYSPSIGEIDPKICILCLDFINSAAYRLLVKESEQTLYFDEECFNQFLAVGIGLFQQRTQEPKN